MSNPTKTSMLKKSSGILKKSSDSAAKQDPRSAALRVLLKLETQGKPLDQLLDELETGLTFDDPRNRALFNMLVFGVLRHRGRIDWHIKHFSRICFHKINHEILNILRLGIYQLLYLDKVPESAAVNTAVEGAKSAGNKGAASFVNAVLRTLIREKKLIQLPELDPEPLIALVHGKSFPEWMIRRWLKRFGLEETVQLCDALNQIPPITLRTNTWLTDRRTLTESLAPLVVRLELADFSDQAVHVFGLKSPITRWDSYQQGWFQVQDEAAQMITRWFNPRPGEVVLDACAGLGGKTIHIAELMNGQGQVIALDKIPAKLTRLNAEAQRTGLQDIIHTCLCDFDNPAQIAQLQYLNRKTLPDQSPPIFDKIFIDAPCSGLGVIRRNPDIKWNKTEQTLAQLNLLQTRFLNHAASLLKPQGILMYCVCSLEPEETEDVAAKFIRSHPEFSQETQTAPLPPQAESLIDRQGYFRTYPHQTGMDGFFAVKLKKQGTGL